MKKWKISNKALIFKINKIMNVIMKSIKMIIRNLV